MTVRVAAEQTFRMGKADMIPYIQDILYHDPLYKRVSEGNGGVYFSAIVQPNVPLVLGTDMTVTLDESDGATKVRVSTLSQSMIMGDVFGMYDRYVTGFLGKLDKAIKVERHEDLALDGVQFTRSIGWKWQLLIVVAAVLTVPLVIVPLFHLSPFIGVLLVPLVAMAGRAITVLINAVVYRPQSQ
jgi:hypothetical protein